MFLRLRLWTSFSVFDHTKYPRAGGYAFNSLLFAFFPRGHISSCTGLLKGAAVLLKEELQSLGSIVEQCEARAGSLVAGLLHASINNEALEGCCGKSSSKEPHHFSVF